jgi:hypothetical protein
VSDPLLLCRGVTLKQKSRGAVDVPARWVANTV